MILGDDSKKMQHSFIFFSLAVALLFGLLMSRVVKKIGLPAVTGYLIAGLLIGPYALGRFGVPGLGFNTIENVSAFSIISETALGFIAFTIGNEFRLSDLKKTGKQVVVITILETLAAVILVDIALIALHYIIGDKLPLTAWCHCLCHGSCRYAFGSKAVQGRRSNNTITSSGCCS